MADELPPAGLLEPRRALHEYLTVLLREERIDSPAGAAERAPADESDSSRRVTAWTHPEFEVQLFKVGGLQLAVPVDGLHEVVPWSAGIEPQPNQPDWCHGLLSYRGRAVWVIDTAALVLPPDRRELIPNCRPAYILIVGDGCWGLACHDVEAVVSLARDEVKWRGERGRRPWLAGTALGRGCAVLDGDAFAELLG